MTSDTPSTSLTGTSNVKAPAFADFSFKTIGKNAHSSSVPSLLKRLSTIHNESPIDGEDADYPPSSPIDEPDGDDVADTPVNTKVFAAVNDQLRTRHSRLDNLISSFTSHENSLKDLLNLTSSAITLSTSARDKSVQGLALLEQSEAAYKSAADTAAQALETSHSAHTKLEAILAQQTQQESQIIEVRKELCLLAELINAHGTHEERHIREIQHREARREAERERKRLEEERQLREKEAQFEAALNQIKAQLASRSRGRDLVGGPSNIPNNPATSTPTQMHGGGETHAKTPESSTTGEQPFHDSQRLKEQEELTQKRQQDVEAAELKKRELQLRLDQERRQAEQMLVDQPHPQQITPPPSSSAPSPSTSSPQLSNATPDTSAPSPVVSLSAKRKKNKKKPEPVVVKQEPLASPSIFPLVNGSSYHRDETAASSSATGSSTSPVVTKFDENTDQSGHHLLPYKPEVKVEPESKPLIPVAQPVAEPRPAASSSKAQPPPPRSSTMHSTQSEQPRSVATQSAAPPMAQVPRAPGPIEKPPVPPANERPLPTHPSLFRPTEANEMDTSTPSSPPLRRRLAPCPRPTGERQHIPPAHIPPPSVRPAQPERPSSKQYGNTNSQESIHTRRPAAIDNRQQWRDASPMGPEDTVRTVGRYPPPSQPPRPYDHWSPPPDVRRPLSRSPSPPPRSSMKRPRNDIDPPPDYPSRRQPPSNRSFLDRLDTSASYSDLQYPGSRSPLTPPRYSSPTRDDRMSFRDDGSGSRPSFLDRLNVPPSAKEGERDIHRPNPPRAPVSPRGRRPGRARGGKAPLASRITSSTSSLQDRLGI